MSLIAGWSALLGAEASTASGGASECAPPRDSESEQQLIRWVVSRRQLGVTRELTAVRRQRKCGEPSKALVDEFLSVSSRAVELAAELGWSRIDKSENLLASKWKRGEEEAGWGVVLREANQSSIGKRRKEKQIDMHSNELDAVSKKHPVRSVLSNPFLRRLFEGTVAKAEQRRQRFVQATAMATQRHTAPQAPPREDVVFEGGVAVPIRPPIAPVVDQLINDRPPEEELLDILQLQAVSNILASPFRHTMERLIKERVEKNGGGHRAQDAIRRLTERLDRRYGPGAHHRPADPRVASIRAGGDTATGTPMVAIRHLEAEVAAVRREMAELRRLMMTSFELQVDIQRSIRQDVAGLATHTTQGATSLLKSDGQCVICLEGSVQTALYQCGHVCACHLCALRLKEEERGCPLCRAPVKDVLRVYA